MAKYGEMEQVFDGGVTIIKKADEHVENKMKELSSLLKDLFGGSDPFADLKREYKPIKLRKKRATSITKSNGEPPISRRTDIR